MIATMNVTIEIMNVMTVDMVKSNMSRSAIELKEHRTTTLAGTGDINLKNHTCPEVESFVMSKI
jgi:hypothetical protein